MQTGPSPTRGRETGGRKSEPERGNVGPRDSILYQTAIRFPVANQDFLGFWTVDICRQGHSQRSAAQKTHGTPEMARPLCTQETGRLGWGRHKRHPLLGESMLTKHLVPELLGPGKGTNAGPTESVPLWSTREPEPEWLRLGKCTQPRALLRRFPCRAPWSLSSVDWESTHAMSRGKPSVAQTRRALPTHASDICLQYSSLPTAQLKK